MSSNDHQQKTLLKSIKIHLKNINPLIKVGLIIFAALLSYEFIFQLPKAKEAQAQLEIEFNAIEPLLNATSFRYNASHKTSQALVGATYLTDATSTEIFNHYSEQLLQHGWLSHGTRPTTDWGNDLGGQSAYYCKGEYVAQLQYAGQQANYGWTYAFDLSWGLGDCKSASKGGWVQQSFPVALLFFGGGIFIFGNGITIAINSWTKDSSKYMKWLRKRILSDAPWYIFTPKTYSLWSDRMSSIFATFFGFLLLWSGGYSLWQYIFGG